MKLWKRNKDWYCDLVFNGKRIRRSLGKAKREAVENLKRLISNQA